MPKCIMRQESGYIEFILLFLLIMVMIVLWPIKFNSTNNNSATNLSLSVANPCSAGPTGASEVIVDIPDYPPKGDFEANNPIKFKLIRTNVPLSTNFYNSDKHFSLKLENFDIKGEKFNGYYPNPDDDEYPNAAGEIKWPQGIASTRRHPGKTRELLYFTDFKLVFMVQLKDGRPIETNGLDQNKKPGTFWLTDIYQPVDEFSTHPLPDDAFACVDVGNQTPDASVAANKNTFINPEEGKRSQDKSQLQLEYFIPQTQTATSGATATTGGWAVLCKPAIYLYPQKPTQVNVKVNTKGFLTYTLPEYPDGGWKATAYPNGDLIVDGKSYPYLYYESKIPDNLITIPQVGYNVSFRDLPNLYDYLLPKLGLDPKQTKDFKDYWSKALPYSAYYFVGILPQQQSDQIEPLEITPRPDTNIRVRLYFQPQNQKQDAGLPQIITPQKTGFTMVEWGGMVKMDKNHPFTCSQ